MEQWNIVITPPKTKVLHKDSWNDTDVMESDHHASSDDTCGYGEETKGKRNCRHRTRVWDEKNQRRSNSNFEPRWGNHLSKGWVFHIDGEKSVYIPTLQENFDSTKSHFPDAKGENEFKEKVRSERRNRKQDPGSVFWKVSVRQCSRIRHICTSMWDTYTCLSMNLLSWLSILCQYNTWTFHVIFRNSIMSH